ncbi:MAG: hypothetical protein WA810_14630 [Maribacter sp.]
MLAKASILNRKKSNINLVTFIFALPMATLKETKQKKRRFYNLVIIIVLLIIIITGVLAQTDIELEF